MREMKDSGVSWIGEIPADWEVHKVSSSFSEKKEKNTDYEFDRAFKFRYGTLEPKNESGDITELRETYLLYTIVDKGDIVINCLNLNYDFISQRVAIVPHRGIITSAYLILKPRDGLYSDYFTYLFKAMDNMKLFHGMGSGVRLTLTFKDLKHQPMVIPPQAEQHRIVSYLDTKCAKIDAIIARQQQVIEKLKAYKLSVITEAVTKGLNPDVPMKDSGIEWIGAVPSAWRISQLKYFATVRSGITLGKKYPKDAELVEVPYLRVANVQGEYVDLTDVAHILVLPVEAEKYQLHKGELLMTEGGDRDKLGRGCVWNGEIEPCLHQNHVYAVTTDSQHLSVHFLDYMTTSAVARNYFDYTAKKTTNLASTNATTILQFRFPIPPVEEQLAIVEYLNQICQRTDHVIAQHSAIIDKLTEYKKSLIYEVVTGKREIAADLSAVTSVVVLAPALIAELHEKRAALMVRFIDGLGDKNKGRTQIQKCMSLAEGLIDLQLGIQLVRQHYGPYDEDIQTYEQIMAEHKWVNHAKKKGRIQYTRGKRFQEYHSVYQRFFGDYDCEIQRIIDFVKPIKHTSEIGRMATLFAAWNDFILDGIPNPTDEQIISEVRSNWTDNKANTSVETWQDSLNKLRAADMVPRGYGRHTVKLEEGDRTHG